MTDFFILIGAIAVLGTVLIAFRMGYQAGRQEERLFADVPDIVLPDIDEVEKAPTHDEIMKDMEKARTIMQGYDFDA